MKRLTILFLLIHSVLMSQENEELPYYNVPEYYSEYTVGTVSARMIDGLGFRFRWATEDLRTEDLQYKISEDGRTIQETIDHVYGLSNVIVNAVLQQPNDYTKKQPELSDSKKRTQALLNMEKASQILSKSDNLENFNLIFISKNGKREFPFWNAINGPIEDAVWHAGQIVAMRRASGNPLRKGVSFLAGTVSD